MQTELTPSSPPADHITSQYLDGLGDKRTARHASEEGLDSPEPEEVSAATREIRQDLRQMFTIADNREFSGDSVALTRLKQSYWARAGRVGTEHGAKPGFDLDDYFKVGPTRTYEAMKEALSEAYPLSTIPGSVLDGIDAYHTVLEINPAHAATIMTELIGRGLPQISMMADTVASEGGLSHQEATTAAFVQFITNEVPYHLNSIMSQYGRGDASIKPYMAKASFYPQFEQTENDVKLELSVGDVKGLVRVYDIQSRPYDEEELSMANDLAAQPAMQAAMIRIQEHLVASSEDYLRQHPERASGDLRNFSEIFVPQREGEAVELLPNPKLLRAIVNNVLPGIAKNLRSRGLSQEDIDQEAINQGVEMAAHEYRLFSSNIGQFDNYDEKKGTAELHSMYKVVCPANALFPNTLKTHLATYFEEEKSTQG